MSQENTIILRGFVTAEPRFWQSPPTHTPLAEIRMGHTPRRLNRETGEWVDGPTSYYDVKCWRRLALNVKGSLRKGDMILVKGKVYMREWVDDQQRKHVRMQVEAESVGHDLAYGWSHFNRGDQSPWNSARRSVEGEPSQPGGDAYPGDMPAPDGADYEGGEDVDAAGLVPPPSGPEMDDADFQRLTSDLGVKADVEPVF